MTEISEPLLAVKKRNKVEGRGRGVGYIRLEKKEKAEICFSEIGKQAILIVEKK